jgi:hypothetical protein
MPARAIEISVQGRVLHTVMHEDILAAASRLSDDALHARLQDLASRERHSTVDLVAHLAVLLGRKKDLGQGWGSVYRWCCDTLHLSHDAAYNRVAAARAVRRFPVILDHLATGFVNVTTVKVLRPVLTQENHKVVLAEARYRSRKECELIVARLQPKPDVPSTIRKLPSPTPAPAPALFVAPEGSTSTPPDIPTAPAPARPPVIAALTPERFRYQFTVSKDTHDKVRHLQDLLCREIPNGDAAVLFDRAVDAHAGGRGEEACGNVQAARAQAGDGGLAPHSGPRGTRRLEEGRESMRIQGNNRSVCRDAVSRAASHPARWLPRAGDGGEHLRPMPRAQRLRERAGLRSVDATRGRVAQKRRCLAGNRAVPGRKSCQVDFDL